MNLSGAASLHIFRAELKDFSTSSLVMSGVYLAILHASVNDGHTHMRPWEKKFRSYSYSNTSSAGKMKSKNKSIYNKMIIFII